MPVEYGPYRSEFLEPLATLISHNFAVDGVEFVMTPTELQEMLDGSTITPELDYRLALSDGVLVGFASVSHRLSEGDFARALLGGGVATAHRGRGIGTELLAWAVTRAVTRLADAAQDLPAQLWCFAYQQQADRQDLLTAAGFGVERYFHEMLRPLTDQDRGPSAPDGVRIVPYSKELDRQVHAVEVEAFNDHWGSIPMSEELWATFMTAESTRLDLSYLAMVGDEVVGLSINAHYAADETVSGRREGWIDSLGTKRAWRKKGIATALLEKSFEAFEKEGFSHATLGVDSTSPTGAAELYSNVGFAPVRTELLFIQHV